MSNFRLHPVVTVTGARPSLTLADGEVARVLEVDIGELTGPERWVSVEREQDGRAIIVPAFQFGHDEIWGATAMALAEFLVLLGWNLE